MPVSVAITFQSAAQILRFPKAEARALAFAAESVFQSAAQILRFPKLDLLRRAQFLEDEFQSAAQILRFPKLGRRGTGRNPLRQVSICRADSSLPKALMSQRGRPTRLFQSAAQILRFPKTVGDDLDNLQRLFQSAAQILRFPKAPGCGRPRRY